MHRRLRMKKSLITMLIDSLITHLSHGMRGEAGNYLSLEEYQG